MPRSGMRWRSRKLMGRKASPNPRNRQPGHNALRDLRRGKKRNARPTRVDPASRRVIYVGDVPTSGHFLAGSGVVGAPGVAGVDGAAVLPEQDAFAPGAAVSVD